MHRLLLTAVGTRAAEYQQPTYKFLLIDFSVLAATSEEEDVAASQDVPGRGLRILCFAASLTWFVFLPVAETALLWICQKGEKPLMEKSVAWAREGLAVPRISEGI